MNASELRIGNLVQSNPISIPRLGLSGDGVEAVTAYGIHEFGHDLIKWHPIPLTEEWLLKFGLNNGKNIFEFEVLYDDHAGYGVLYCGYPLGGIEYVHQLQNLYFALTGEELSFAQ